VDFARNVAESCFAQPWAWSDYADGWRHRFAQSAGRDAMAWGLEDQVGAMMTAAVETGLMRQAARQNLPLVRHRLLRLASDLVQVLRMLRLNLDPSLLAITEEEYLDQVRRLYGEH
jgi:hypothetical protein